MVRRADLDGAPVKALVEVLRSAAFRSELEGLGGYGLDKLGAQVAQT